MSFLSWLKSLLTPAFDNEIDRFVKEAEDNLNNKDLDPKEMK